MAVSAVLKRFDRYFYQPRPSDGAIVPIDLGILAFYAQGATLVEQVSLAAGATSAAVHVYHPGTFVTGGAVHNASLVYSGDGSDSRQTELWFNADGTVLFKNLGAAFVFAAGSRFLNSGVPLSAFRSPQGVGSVITAQTDSSGRATCYVGAYRYDYVLEHAAATKHLIYIDAEGSYVTR